MSYTFHVLEVQSIGSVVGTSRRAVLLMSGYRRARLVEVLTDPRVKRPFEAPPPQQSTRSG
jgi:hypothetical protein